MQCFLRNNRIDAGQVWIVTYMLCSLLLDAEQMELGINSIELRVKLGNKLAMAVYTLFCLFCIKCTLTARLRICVYTTLAKSYIYPAVCYEILHFDVCVCVPPTSQLQSKLRKRMTLLCFKLVMCTQSTCTGIGRGEQPGFLLEG